MPGVEPGSNLLRDLKLRQPRGLRLRLAAAVSLPTCKEFHTTPCPRGFGLGGGFLCPLTILCATIKWFSVVKFDTWGQIVPRSTLPPKV